MQVSNLKVVAASSKMDNSQRDMLSHVKLILRHFLLSEMYMKNVFEYRVTLFYSS